MDTSAIEKAAAGKKVSQKAVVDEANALLAKAESATKSKKNYLSKYRNAGRVLIQKGVTTTTLTLSSLLSGRFHKSKVVSPGVRMGVGLLLDVGGMGAELSGVKHANLIHAVGDGIFFSGLGSKAESYGREMADKADKAAPPTPAAEEKPPAGVSRPGRPRLPGARDDDEDFVLSPKKKRREVVRLGRN